MGHLNSFLFIFLIRCIKSVRLEKHFFNAQAVKRLKDPHDAREIGF